MPLELNPEQLDTLRHMLGINTPAARTPVPYRNYAAVVPGDVDFAGLEKLGAVECYRRAADGQSYDYFRCTDDGRSAAMASHSLIRKTRSQRVYLAWLHLSDALPDVTFHDFLVGEQFKATRQAA